MGHGAPQDYAEEAKWYREAAQHGAEPQWAREAMAGKDGSTAYAQENLGWMYYLGKGVPKDLVTAHMWLNLAAARGDAQAADNRREIEAEMTPAQIVEAQRMASEWVPKK